MSCTSVVMCVVWIAIPSLQCIVNDLFIVRAMNKSDAGKDLETQREVVISMLLRLLQHYQVVIATANSADHNYKYHF